MGLEQVKQQELKKIEDTADSRDARRRAKWIPTPSERKFPLWLRSIIVLVLMAVAVVGGLMVGYSVIGNGNSAMDVFRLEIWQHILEFFRI